MVTLDQVRYILGDWVDTILSLSHALYDMDIDLYAFACLCALTLVNGEYLILVPKVWDYLVKNSHVFWAHKILENLE